MTFVITPFLFQGHASKMQAVLDYSGHGTSAIPLNPFGTLRLGSGDGQSNTFK